MSRLYVCVAVVCVGCFTAPLAHAAYTQLNIPQRLDYAFDPRGVLYVTAGSQIVRYDLRSGAYLTPWDVGGNLIGIDISPDGSTLAVADSTVQGNQNRIHLVNTTTGAAQPVNFTRGFGESGTFMLGWGADGKVLVTSAYNGSGWVPLRRHDPQSGTTQEIRSVRQNTMLSPSADRNTIGLVESNISSGPVLAYDVPAGDVKAETGTGWFMFEVAVSRDGTQFVVPSYNGAYVYDRTATGFQLDRKLGQYASYGPIAAAFAPNADFLFTSEYDWDDRVSGVKVYDTSTWSELAVIDPYRFEWNGNHAMGPGRMEISPDGRWLAVSVDGGTRLYDVSAWVPEPGAAMLLVTVAGLLLRRR